MLTDSLVRKLIQLINDQTKYMRTYIGYIVDTNDELMKGRLKVCIPDLGVLSQDVAFWCCQSGMSQVTMLSVNDWVRVGFHNNSPSHAYIIGQATEVNGTLPQAFTGEKTFNVLYESAEHKMQITHNEQTEAFTIQDKNGNKIVMDKTGILFQDKNGNKIEMVSGEVKINGTNLEVGITP